MVKRLCLHYLLFLHFAVWCQKNAAQCGKQRASSNRAKKRYPSLPLFNFQFLPPLFLPFAPHSLSRVLYGDTRLAKIWLKLMSSITLPVLTMPESGIIRFFQKKRQMRKRWLKKCGCWKIQCHFCVDHLASLPPVETIFWKNFFFKFFWFYNAK